MTNTKTLKEFNEQLAICKEVFEKKHQDYGASWVIMRVSSLIDQLFIKAQRIRNIQTTDQQKIQDNERIEFVGLVNYAIMALIQLEKTAPLAPQSSWEQLERLYDQQARSCVALLQEKNHDYDEAWRLMRVSSMTDIILTKIYRIQQIEEHGVKFSEGLASNFQDILNYSVFCLILLKNNP